MYEINHLFTYGKCEVVKEGGYLLVWIASYQHQPRGAEGPLPAEQAVALRAAEGTEPREAAVEIILVSRLGEPIGCLCCSHHRPESILCKNTVISFLSVFCFCLLGILFDRNALCLADWNCAVLMCSIVGFCTK